MYFGSVFESSTWILLKGRVFGDDNSLGKDGGGRMGSFVVKVGVGAGVIEHFIDC